MGGVVDVLLAVDVVAIVGIWTEDEESAGRLDELDDSVLVCNLRKSPPTACSCKNCIVLRGC